MTSGLRRPAPANAWIEPEELARILDSTAEAIYGLDMQGNCMFCNSACLRFLGYQDPVELIGKKMHTMMHHSRPDGTPYPSEECRIYSAFRRGEGSHVDDEVVWRADGTSFPVEYWSQNQRTPSRAHQSVEVTEFLPACRPSGSHLAAYQGYPS